MFAHPVTASPSECSCPVAVQKRDDRSTLRKFNSERLTYQAIQLADRTLAAGLGDVPNFDTSLSAGVDVFGWVGDGDGADDLTVGKRIDLAGMSRDSGSG